MKLKRKQIIEKNLNISFNIQDMDIKDAKQYLKGLNTENNNLIARNLKTIYFYIALIIISLLLIPAISIISLVFIILFVLRIGFLYNQNQYLNSKFEQNLEIINN